MQRYNDSVDESCLYITSFCRKKKVRMRNEGKGSGSPPDAYGLSSCLNQDHAAVRPGTVRDRPVYFFYHSWTIDGCSVIVIIFMACLHSCRFQEAGMPDQDE